RRILCYSFPPAAGTVGRTPRHACERDYRIGHRRAFRSPKGSGTSLGVSGRAIPNLQCGPLCPDQKQPGIGSRHSQARIGYQATRGFEGMRTTFKCSRPGKETGIFAYLENLVSLPREVQCRIIGLFFVLLWSYSSPWTLFAADGTTSTFEAANKLYE